MKRAFLIILLLAFGLTVLACAPKPAGPEPTATPAVTAEPTPTPTPTPTPEPTPYDMTGNGVVDAVDETALQLHLDGKLPAPETLPELLANSLLGEAYFEKFCYTGEERSEGFYRNALVSMTLETVADETIRYHVADIYVRDLSCFRTAIADDAFGRWAEEPVVDMAARTEAVVAVSGDYYSARPTGLMARNGVWYRETIDRAREVCVLYLDGTMETYSPKQIDLEAIKARGVWQVWGFGPGLLDAEGQPKTTFLSKVRPANPRSAIGYYEPGHYCLVVVEGRGVNGSQGMSLQALSELFHSLGCRAAYNLDGGATAIMADAVGAISEQSKSRGCSDIVYLGALPTALPLPGPEPEASAQPEQTRPEQTIEPPAKTEQPADSSGTPAPEDSPEPSSTPASLSKK